MAHKYRPLKPYRHPNGMLRVVVYICDETLADIQAEAERFNCSVSSATAMLIEVGIEAFKKEHLAERDTPA
jgi:hypothetical protein